MTITIERLREVLSYDPNTGEFTWLVSLSRKPTVGRVAGRIRTRGYRSIDIDCHRYNSHRLAWFYVHGRWPERFLDHIDGNTGNNRIANLREADDSQNQANRRSRNSALPKGVTKLRSGRFQAALKVRHQSLYLGCFDSAEEAGAAYFAAAKKHYGDFARAA